MDITELAQSGKPWPHPVQSADGRVVGPAGLDLPMPQQPHPYLARMARFTNGSEHRARRAEAVAALPPLEGLEEAAHRDTVERIGPATRLDVAPLAFTVPIVTLGRALGVEDLTAEIGALCDNGTVSERLPDLARTSLLFQCRDAVAALVLDALADGTAVDRTEPVVLTRRAGDIWVLLADRTRRTPYGAGTHACPGRDHAIALATGMVRAFDGWVVAERGPNSDRVNIRIPTRLVMERP